MRVVVDAAVIAASLRSPSGASAKLVRTIDAGLAIMVLSKQLAMDYEFTCLDEPTRAAAGLTQAEVLLFLDGLFALSEPVIPALQLLSLNIPGTEAHVLSAALSGSAAAIVSFDRGTYANAYARYDLLMLTPQDALSRITR